MEVTEASVLLLPFAAASVGVARRRLVSDLIAADVYDSAVCDVALVISELFSNALRHAAPLPGRRYAWPGRSIRPASASRSATGAPRPCPSWASRPREPPEAAG